MLLTQLWHGSLRQLWQYREQYFNQPIWICMTMFSNPVLYASHFVAMPDIGFALLLCPQTPVLVLAAKLRSLHNATLVYAAFVHSSSVTVQLLWVALENMSVAYSLILLCCT